MPLTDAELSFLTAYIIEEHRLTDPMPAHDGIRDVVPPTPRAGQGRVLKEWTFCPRCAVKARIDYWWDNIDMRIPKLLCPGRISPPAPLFWTGSSMVTTRHTICRGTWAEVRPGFSAAIDRIACSGLSAPVSRKGGEPP